MATRVNISTTLSYLAADDIVRAKALYAKGKDEEPALWKPGETPYTCGHHLRRVMRLVFEGMLLLGYNLDFYTGKGPRNPKGILLSRLVSGLRIMEKPDGSIDTRQSRPDTALGEFIAFALTLRDESHPIDFEPEDFPDVDWMLNLWLHAIAKHAELKGMDEFFELLAKLVKACRLHILNRSRPTDELVMEDSVKFLTDRSAQVMRASLDFRAALRQRERLCDAVFPA